MKVIDLAVGKHPLPELLRLAGKDGLILRTREGREFILAQIEEFDAEIAAIIGNKKLTRLLRQRSREKAELTIEEVRKRLTT